MTEAELRIRKRLVEIDCTISAIVNGEEYLYAWLVHETAIRKSWLADLRVERDRLVENVPVDPLPSSISGGA